MNKGKKIANWKSNHKAPVNKILEMKIITIKNEVSVSLNFLLIRYNGYEAKNVMNDFITSSVYTEGTSAENGISINNIGVK
ncbi:MAG: hypothetical protein QW050_03540 [Candidatus Nitrosocaldaceae archaeon]